MAEEKRHLQHKKDDPAMAEASNKEHNHDHREHGGGMDIGLLEYVDAGTTVNVATAYFEKKYEAVTGQKMADRMVGLISAEDAKKAKEREEAQSQEKEADSDSDWIKNKRVYQF